MSTGRGKRKVPVATEERSPAVAKKKVYTGADETDLNNGTQRRTNTIKPNEKKILQKNGGKDINVSKRKSIQREKAPNKSLEEAESLNGNDDDKEDDYDNAPAHTDEHRDVPDDEEEEYEVAAILDHKIERGNTMFLVRWKGYTKNDDTWEVEDSLSCRELIEKFQRKKAKEQNGADDAKTPSKTNKSHMPVKKRQLGEKKDDPNKEWEVEKIIDYAEEKMGRVFRIRWKGFGSRSDTWEPEYNLNCDKIIEKFMQRMKSQENVTFKELREETKKPKRLLNETAPRSTYSLAGRKSKRSMNKKRVYYGDSD